MAGIRMRENVIVVGAIGLFLTVILLVGAWLHPGVPVLSIGGEAKAVAAVAQPVVASEGAVDDIPDDPESPIVDVPLAAPTADAPVLVPAATPVVIADVGLPSVAVPPIVAAVGTPLPSTAELQSSPDPLQPSIRRPAAVKGTVPILMYHYVRVNPVASDRAGFV